MTVDEVAEYFRASHLTVRRWIAAGKLNAIRSPGGRLLVSAEAIAAIDAAGAGGAQKAAKRAPRNPAGALNHGQKVARKNRHGGAHAVSLRGGR